MSVAPVCVWSRTFTANVLPSTLNRLLWDWMSACPPAAAFPTCVSWSAMLEELALRVVEVTTGSRNVSPEPSPSGIGLRSAGTSVCAEAGGAARTASTASPHRRPAVLQPHVGHVSFRDLGEQRKLAHREAPNDRRRWVRSGRPVDDVSGENHARIGCEFLDPRPLARRRGHRVLGAARGRFPAHHAAPAADRRVIAPINRASACGNSYVLDLILWIVHTDPGRSI